MHVHANGCFDRLELVKIRIASIDKLSVDSLIHFDLPGTGEPAPSGLISKVRRVGCKGNGPHDADDQEQGRSDRSPYPNVPGRDAIEDCHSYFLRDFSILAQVSRNVTVRLNTRRVLVVSRSTQKYPWRSN